MVFFSPWFFFSFSVFMSSVFKFSLQSWAQFASLLLTAADSYLWKCLSGALSSCWRSQTIANSNFHLFETAEEWIISLLTVHVLIQKLHSKLIRFCLSKFMNMTLCLCLKGCSLKTGTKQYRRDFCPWFNLFTSMQQHSKRRPSTLRNERQALETAGLVFKTSLYGQF